MTEEWPTWNTRLGWAKTNYRRNKEHDIQWKIRKFLLLLVNLTAMSDLIEEEAQEQLLTPKQTTQWREMYEDYRPNNT